MSFPGMQQQPPQGGTGAVAAPRPMMGAAAHGMAAVRTAVEALQKALPGLPMGSELHTAVLKSITDLSRRLEGGGDHAAQTQVMSQMARENQQNPMAAALQRMQPGAPGQPNAPPMMPQAGAQ
jgi:hypothetical protein